MPRTHLQIVELAETRLLAAMIACNKAELYKLLHRDFVMMNENGEVFSGIDSLQINEPKILRIKTTEIQERSIHFFNTVAVVNSSEIRTGTFRDLYFERHYHITRIWKFEFKSWKLINATIVLM